MDVNRAHMNYDRAPRVLKRFKCGSYGHQWSFNGIKWNSHGLHWLANEDMINVYEPSMLLNGLTISSKSCKWFPIVLYSTGLQ